MKEDHQQTITGRDNQIQALEFTNEKGRQAHQQEILRLNEEINDLIANRHVARCVINNVLASSKRRAEKFTHTTLFDVSTDSWKNIGDGVGFVTQTWRWPTNVMIQTPFTDDVDLSVK